MTNPRLATIPQLADLARALASENRLTIIEQLAKGGRSVEQLAALTGLSHANTSHHLQQLRRVGLVQSRRAGKHVICGLHSGVEAMLAALVNFTDAKQAAMIAVADDYLHHPEALEAVTRDDLLARLEAGEVMLLDVRPGDEFGGGHIPGALNLPFEELKKRLAELPRDKEIVAYCRGPNCVLSLQAVAYLRERGFKVRRMEDGVSEWRAAGLAIAN